MEREKANGLEPCWIGWYDAMKTDLLHSELYL